MYISRGTKTFATILIFIVVVVTLWAVFTPADVEDYEAEKLEWSVGSIDVDTGLFVKDSEDTMVSNLIDVRGGFKVVPEYTSGASYDLFFFDDNGNYISKEMGLKTNTVREADECPVGTVSVRVVLHPVDDSESINLVEKLIYATYVDVSTKPLAE